MEPEEGNRKIVANFNVERFEYKLDLHNNVQLEFVNMQSLCCRKDLVFDPYDIAH